MKNKNFIFTYSVAWADLSFYPPSRFLDETVYSGKWLDEYWAYDKSGHCHVYLTIGVWEDFFGEMLQIDFEKRDVYL